MEEEKMRRWGWTMFVYFMPLWRGPTMSNAETNKLMNGLIDGLGFGHDSHLFAWYWRVAMDD